ncbi:Zn-ribbon domain-containing OB-fold protein [Halomarina litorea]|uniref:Zn-ribbon domain-containing OB-fold protein n=1 Tax=Halomarina litorea TaxID=2961595 RepID=UPI0020C2AAEA|nr:Zn-ribbon domain-containing OB-fold protein [Halomarina sp. BCD28]
MNGSSDPDDSGDGGGALEIGRYTRPFWSALSEGDFLVHECRDCNRAFFPPAPVCPHCGATEVEWVEASGEAELYSFTRQHTAPPGFDAPVLLGLVELAEGPRVLCAIEGEYGDLELGQAVELVATEYDEGFDRGDLSGEAFFAARPVHDRSE